MTRFRLAVAAAALFLSVTKVSAQQPDSVPGLRRMRLAADTLRLEVPAAFTGAGRLARRVPPEQLAERWADSLQQRLAAREAARWSAVIRGDTAALSVAPPAVYGGGIAAESPPVVAPRGVAVLGQYADLGIQLNALLEMRFDQLHNFRCTAGDAGLITSGCRGGFTPPRLDPQFNVRTGGVVGERVHVNVDYDTQREFDASNNIQLFYQGLEDEMLRRVEVGNVTFAPPRSRFISGGIPANNFGVAAELQFGALNVGGVFAQQKGNVVKARVFSIGNESVQPVDRVLQDRDFEPGRFFFVRDPRSFPGYPALDVLNFNTVAIADSVRVTQVRIYRHRSTIARSPTETNLTGIQAVANRTDSPQRFGPIAWEVMVEGRDYYLDPSGLWFALASRLDDEDYLAVSYITAAGDTVGTFPATAVAGRVDTLELIHEPKSGPLLPTFYYEMRNAYRVGSSTDVDRLSVALQLLVAGSAKPPGGAATFLQLLGLSLNTDATTFDQFNRLFPRTRDPNNGSPMREYFILLPSLTPFADSTKLQPQFRTDSLYRTPLYLPRTQWPAPLWTLSLHYNASGGDNRGTLNLGGYQIRTGSERVSVNGRLLERNVEYTINYEVGQVTFLNPDSLFPQPTQVSVQFEENQAFAVAPTSLYGIQAHYDLGEHGSITALGLMQRQQTLFTRPPLGFEPASNAVLGITGNFHFEPLRLTKLLDALPFVQTEAPSLLNLDAEIATSRPSPNQLGVAYVETFEGEAGLFLPLTENSWEFGSRPSSAHAPPGLGPINGIDPTGFRDDDASLLTWQNLIPAGNTGNGIFELPAQAIDPEIIVQGTGQAPETILWLALHADSVGGLPDANGRARWLVPHTPATPRWRSITEPLSATGTDLSRVEYLEFWVLDKSDASAAHGLSLVFDFGTVFEDAVDFQPTAMTVAGADTTFTGRRRAGEGRLDTERDTLTGAFNAVINDVGILGDVADSLFDNSSGSMAHNVPLCTSQLGQSLHVYNWGSLLQHCTRKNGVPDTEDLNNDQHLDTLIQAQGEHVLRYVFEASDRRYYVRDGGTVTGYGTWKLYRIPFRSDTSQIGTPDIRQVRALRMTVVAPAGSGPDGTLFFALARMRLVGAPWIKRAATPIAGLSGLVGQPHGEVLASVVGTEDTLALGYTPPPGVTNEGQSVGSAVTPGATQINEKSLRLVAYGVQPGERAEAFLRFPEGDRNFLGYREMRVWARGRGADWDANRLTFYIKVGQDENNFYLFRQNLRTTTWLPEAVIDFQRWFALRALVEERFLRGDPPSGAAGCGGDTLAYVACDGPYMVHVRNPGVAPPNLTRVQELAVGFVRDSGNALDSAEVWVDDIRLSQVVDDHGYAGAIDLSLIAADIGDFNLSMTRRDGNFRQLGENPAYTGTNTVGLASTIRLERLGLNRLGLTVPLTLRMDRASQDPYFVNGTDVLASGLNGLRTPRTTGTSWAIAVRRSRRGTAWWQRALTDNLGFGALWSSGDSRTELASSNSKLTDMRLDYSLQPADHHVPLLPGFLRSALDALPDFMRRTDLVRGLRGSNLRLTPATLSLGTNLVKTRSLRESYRVAIATPFDTVPATVATAASLRSNATLDLRPSGSLALTVLGLWDRDLKDYGDSTTMGALASERAQSLFGTNIGFVRQRSLTTRLNWNPPLASWLRARLGWSSDFALSRDPNANIPERTQGDSAGGFRLPTSYGNGTGLDLSASFDVSRLLRGVFGDSSGAVRILDRVTQLDVGRRVDMRSQFDRPGFDPGLSYMLGLTGFGGFRAQDSTLASSALHQQQDRVNLVMRLPLNLAATGTYAERVADLYFLRGQSQQLQTQTEKEWPSLSMRWIWSPRTVAVRRYLAALNASVGYQVRSSANDQPPLEGVTGSSLRSSQTTTGTPVSVSLTWSPGIVTSLSLTDDAVRIENVGNITRGDRSSKSADVSFQFRTPQEFLPLKSPVRATLRVLSSVNLLCVERVGGTGCTPIADSRHNEYNLTMDTDMPPSVTAGLSIGYVLNDDRHINRKFSQFTLTASARLYFSAGQVR